jgi:DNA-binding MarR family transcriptional regulator
MVIKHIGKDTGLSQGELGRRLIVTPSNITRLLDRLEQDGYIERISRKGDRRVNLIRITKNGSDILDKVWPGYRNRINELANNLTQDEQKLLSKMMLEWFSKLNNGSKTL